MAGGCEEHVGGEQSKLLQGWRVMVGTYSYWAMSEGIEDWYVQHVSDGLDRGCWAEGGALLNEAMELQHHAWQTWILTLAWLIMELHDLSYGALSLWLDKMVGFCIAHNHGFVLCVFGLLQDLQAIT